MRIVYIGRRRAARRRVRVRARGGCCGRCRSCSSSAAIARLGGREPVRRRTRLRRSSGRSSATTRRWIDHAGRTKRSRYLYDGEPSWTGVWETVFWNDHIDRVYDLGTRGAGPAAAGSGRGRRRRDALRSAGGRAPELRDRIDVDRARRRAQGCRSQQQGLTQAGLVLWHLADVPLRMLSQTSGLQVNGDIYGPDTGRLDAYDCAGHLPVLAPDQGRPRRSTSCSTGSSSRHLDPRRPGDAGTATSRSSRPRAAVHARDRADGPGRDDGVRRSIAAARIGPCPPSSARRFPTACGC